MPKALVAVITIIIVILLGLGAWWFLTTQPADNSTTASPKTTSNNQTSTPSADGITIVFNDNGFEQQNYKVAAGQTVTVKNESSIVVGFSSNEHPTHTDNPELNMDALDPDEQTTFTSDTAGEWGVHDHEHPEFTATLTVKD